MLPAERYDFILKYIDVHDYVKIGELCKLLNTTEPTLRTDLSYLESLGSLVKIRGGAASLSYASNGFIPEESNYIDRQRANIAKLTAQQIPENSIVCMDDSSIILKVAQELVMGNKNLTIVTRFIDIVHIFLKNTGIKIIFCGGEISHKSRCSVGEIPSSFLAEQKIDIALLGAQGISRSNGFFHNDEEGIEAKKIVIDKSNEIWICADHSKFDKTGSFKLFDFSEVDVLFTDKVSVSWQNFLKDQNLKIYTL